MSTQRFARRYALALAGVLGLGLSALGQTTYYVSQSAGNDDSNGTTAATPWKTLAKASAVTRRPGDKLLLKCGDTWNEGLTLRGDGSASNLVTVASYGTGERPLISRTKGNRNACILIDKASGYRIRDLELSFAQNGIRIEADSRVRTEQGDYLIENCFFHDTAGNPDFRGGNHEQYVHMGWAIYTDGFASPKSVKIKNLTVRTIGQKFAFSPDHGGGNAGSGLSVGSNGIGVYEHGAGYMPALAVATNAIGTGWNYVSVVYANKQPSIYVNGVCVRKNGTSQRTVLAPYAIGGMVYGYFAGSMDEVRVSGVARSADWIRAEYLNMASNDLFAAYGGAEQAGKVKK